MTHKQQIMVMRILCLMVMSMIVTLHPIYAADDPTITLENITQLTQLDRLGRGTASRLDWHPDGEVVAIAGGWGVWLLDEDFNEVAHLQGIPRTTDIAWHPDGDVLATLHETEIRFWQIADDYSSVTETGELIVDAAGDTFWPDTRCIAWSNDGAVIGVGSRSRWAEDDSSTSIVIYDVEAEQQIEDASVDPDLEKRLIARCRGDATNPDNTVETLSSSDYCCGSTFGRIDFLSADTTDDPPYVTFPVPAMRSMDWHPDGDYLTVIYQHQLVNVRYPEPQRGGSFPFFDGRVEYAAWSPDGNALLIYNDYTPQANIWTVQPDGYNHIQIQTYHGLNDSARVYWSKNNEEFVLYYSEYQHCCSWNADFINIFTGETTRSIWATYRATRGEFFEHLQWNDDYTRHAVYESETNSIYVGGFDGEPGSAYWDGDLWRFVAQGGEPLPTTRVPGTFPDFHSLDWRDDELVVTLIEDEVATEYILDPDTGELTEFIEEDPIHALRWQWRGLSGSEPEDLLYYDLTLNDPVTGEQLSFTADLPMPNAKILEAGQLAVVSDVHPSEPLVAVTVGGGINFWSLEDGSLLYSVSTERDIGALDWNPAGTLLAAGSMDGTVYLFGLPEE